MDGIDKIINEYIETKENFIFKTIYPYCTEVIEQKVSKAELKRLLNKGLQYDETVDELSKRNNELRETCDRITNRNNELRGKILRLINNNEELKKSLEIQVDNNITMEHQIDRIKEIVQEVDNG